MKTDVGITSEQYTIIERLLSRNWLPISGWTVNTYDCLVVLFLIEMQEKQMWNEYLFAITQQSTFICLDKPAVCYLFMFSIRGKYWPGFSWLVQQQITFCISTANMFTFFPYSSKLITINTSTKFICDSFVFTWWLGAQGATAPDVGHFQKKIKSYI